MDGMAVATGAVIGLVVGAALAAAWAGRRARRVADDVAAREREAAGLAAVRLAEETARTAAARAEAAASGAAADRLLAENAELRERAATDLSVVRALEPVQAKLGDVEQQVALLERQRAEQYGALAAGLRASAQADERLRQQTEALAGALRTTSARGPWGEVELRRVLEVSGLLPHVDFMEQPVIASASEAGRSARPDVVVHRPGGNHLAVDAKAPLAAFLEAGSRPEARDRLMAQHAAALRDHIRELAGREYWAKLDVSPEFTVLFLPSENLLGEALRADANLMEYALAQKVALTTPATLLALLKTVAVIWQQATLTDEARDLLQLGRTLYQRLASLGGHVGKMGRALEAAVAAHNKLVGSLERGVLPAARRFPAFDEASLPPLQAITEEKAQVRRPMADELSEAAAEA
jgi:DNA recombination protein RmuC